MVICGIYKITSPSGRVYIGQAVNIERRHQEYRGLLNKIKGQPRLYASFKKHGVEKHIFETLEECEESELNCRERFWQDEFDVLSKRGLNCVLQECGEKVRVISEETRRKLSEASKGRVVSEETRRKLSAGNKGRKRTESQLNEMRKRRHSEEACKKMSNSRKGKAHTEYTKKKMKDRWVGKIHPRTGTVVSQESREKMSKAKKGIKFSDEVIKQRSEKMKGSDNPKSKLVLCITTGIYYPCLKEACIAMGGSYVNLSKMINPNNPRKNKTDLIYV